MDRLELHALRPHRFLHVAQQGGLGLGAKDVGFGLRDGDVEDRLRLADPG